MPRRLFPLLLLLGLGSVPAFSQGPASAGAPEQMTVITSDRLLYDYRNQFAVFDDNVVVIDPQMKLTADKLTVRFDKNNQVQFIEARGQVYIDQQAQNFTARAEMVTYHVKEGKIVLEDNPQVVRNGSILQGGVITYWRFEDRLTSDKGTKLIIPSKEKDRAGQPPLIPGKPEGAKP